MQIISFQLRYNCNTIPNDISTSYGSNYFVLLDWSSPDSAANLGVLEHIRVHVLVRVGLERRALGVNSTGCVPRNNVYYTCCPSWNLLYQTSSLVCIYGRNKGGQYTVYTTDSYQILYTVYTTELSYICPNNIIYRRSSIYITVDVSSGKTLNV